MPKIGSIGIPELLIILVVVLLIFGPRRLPDMAKGLGQSVREFRKGLRDMRKEFDDEASDETGKPAAAQAAAAATTSTATVATPAAAPQQAVAADPGQADQAVEAERPNGAGATAADAIENGKDSGTPNS